VSGVPQQEITAHLSALRDSELLYERGVFPQATYIFRHSLTQEVAYDSLLEKRKREIHERIGQAIVQLYGDRLEEFYEVLAHHYSRCEDGGKAYEYLKLAGDKALRSHSTWEAFRHYKEAINVLSELPMNTENKTRALDIRLAAANVGSFLGYPEECLKILREAETLAEEVGDYRKLATFYGRMGLYYSLVGDPARGAKYQEKSFAEALSSGDVALVALVGNDLCGSLNIGGECTRTVEVSGEAIALIEETGQEAEFFGRAANVYSQLLAYRASALGMLGCFAEGEPVGEMSLRLARQTGTLFGIAFAEFCCGSVLASKGDGRGTVEIFQSGVRHCEEGQVGLLLGQCRSGVGLGCLLLGDAQTAIDHMVKGIQCHRDAGMTFFLSWQYVFLAEAQLDSGDLGGAQASAEQALEFALQHREKHFAGLAKAVLGRTRSKADTLQSAKAEDLISEGIRELEALKLRPYFSRGYLYLGELYADTGQKDKALEALKKAEAEFKDMGVDYWLKKTQEVLARAEG
jgi:tetratricopeptide (TPR) repeat protein